MKREVSIYLVPTASGSRVKVLQGEFGEKGPRRSSLSLRSKGVTLTALKL